MEVILRGAGEYHLKDNKITCEDGLQVIRKTDEVLELDTLDTDGGGGSNVIMTNCTSISAGNVVNSVIGNGNVMRALGDMFRVGGTVTSMSGGSVVMRGNKSYVNGVELFPCRLETGPVKGMSFNIPKGYKIIHESEKAGESSSSSATPKEPEKPKTTSVVVDAAKIVVITLRDSADFYIHQNIGEDLVELNTEGSGDIHWGHSVKPVFDALNLTISGSGDIKLPGGATINDCNATTNGSGDIMFADRVTIERLVATTNGSGDIAGFHVVRTCRCVVNGSGDITGNYKTGCKVTERANGSGDIKIRPYK